MCEEAFEYIEGNCPQTSIKSEIQQEIFSSSIWQS